MSLHCLLALFFVVAGDGPLSLSGVVVDPADAPIAGAVVAVLTAQGTGIGEAVTDSAGRFGLDGLPPGSYALRVKAGHFETRYVPVTVQSEGSAIHRIRLEIAGTASTVTVTALRGNVENALTASQLVNVRERDSLLQQPLATVGNVLEGTTGVMVQQTTYGQSSPYLRGLTGYQTLLLIDGVRFNTSIFRSGPNQYLSYINPGQVARVEAVLGPTSSTYGSDSLGGTINLLTTETSFELTQGAPRLHGEFSATGASADASGVTDARVSLANSHLYWMAGGTFRRLNNLRTGGGLDSHNAFCRYLGVSPTDTKGLLGNRLIDTAFSQYGGDTKLAVHPTLNQSLTFQYIYSGLKGERSYRDQLGGAGRLQSLFYPQSLNFGYARYERRNLGFLDSLTGTFSVNSQSDGSIKQNLRFTDPITTDDSRVDAYGYSLQGSSHAGHRNVLVYGGEVYDEHIASTRFTFDPTKSTTAQERALYPNGTRYTTTGLFVQSASEIIRGKLRAILGTRYTDVRLWTHAAANVNAAGQSLGVTDSSLAFRDVTFNTGLSWQISRALAVNLLAGRGFRAPNVTNLAALGLSTQGATEIPAYEAAASGALMGVDSGDTALSTGKLVQRLKPESLYNYELGLTYTAGRLRSRVQVFDAELLNPISTRTILFPADGFPASVAGIPVFAVPPTAAQKAQGVVAVATALSARSLKTTVNDGHSKYYGVNSLFSYAVTSRWRVQGNYTFLAGRDLYPNRPASRLPPQQGMISVWYAPPWRELWLELRSRFAGHQSHLSGGDIDDDRVGASRRRSDIASFFRSGNVIGYIQPGADGRLGTSDDVFSPTGETLRNIQDRVLPIGAVVNGVRVVDDSTRVPLHLKAAGWWSLELSGGIPIGERTSLHFGLGNLLDRNYRVLGSGVDAPGLNAFLGLRYLF